MVGKPFDKRPSTATPCPSYQAIGGREICQVSSNSKYTFQRGGSYNREKLVLDSQQNDGIEGLEYPVLSPLFRRQLAAAPNPLMCKLMCCAARGLSHTSCFDGVSQRQDGCHSEMLIWKITVTRTGCGHPPRVRQTPPRTFSGDKGGHHLN